MKEKCSYFCSEEIAVNIWTALQLGKPMLVEGPPGCGKTSLAGVLSTVFDMDLIRLQCYEGVGAEQALYEWNYSKQILDIQRGCGANPFSEEYLLERPLLRALRSATRQILLIDEIDKADEEFEAFLLEILSDFQISIPELGTIKAEPEHRPLVLLTSNTTRDLGDALRRRCVYLWIDFPSVETESNILLEKVEEIEPSLALSISRAMRIIRDELQLIKQPSISESLDLASALVAMQQTRLDAAWLDRLSALFIKNKEDLDKLAQKGGGRWVLERA
jgi:MoxR-like ATPase